MRELLSTFMHLEEFICPPEFWPALGYGGAVRYVAIYWEQCGDEAAWADGRINLAGAYWPAYLALLNHNWSPGHPYHWLLGGSDVQAMFWLVIDRETEEGWIVPADQAADLLASQWPAADVDVAADGLGVVSLTDELMAEAIVTVEAVSRAIRQEEADYQALVEALKARPAQWQEETQ